MDTRGQPVQVGVIILFGFLVIAFATFQAVIVPQQNAEVEFQHSQRVQTDVVDVRNSVLTGVATGSSPFVEVELGTQYPPRVLAVNPGQPSGSLRTTTLRQMTITDSEGTDVSDTICPGSTESRTLEYSATYNVYNSPTVYVDNTVAYLSDRGTMLSLSDQRLVSGTTVSLVPLRGDYQSSGSGTTSVGPVPGNVVVSTLTDPTITVPTQLSQSVWSELLASELESGESATVSGDTLTLDLQGEYDIRCSPVGINGAPPSGARRGSGLGSDGGSDVNPGGASDVVLESVSFDSSTDVATATFENKGDRDLTFKQARIPFMYTPNNDVSKTTLNGDSRDELVVRDSFEPVDQDITVPAGGTVDVEFHFDRNVRDLFFGFSTQFSNGVENRYFIEVDGSSGGGGGSGAGTPTPTPTPGGDNSPPSVVIDSASSTQTGSSQGTKTYNVTVTFTPDDPDNNLDTADVIVRNNQGEMGQKNDVDISGQEGNQVTVSLSVSGRTDPNEIEVVVTDTDGVSRSDTTTNVS